MFILYKLRKYVVITDHYRIVMDDVYDNTCEGYMHINNMSMCWIWQDDFELYVEFGQITIKIDKKECVYNLTIQIKYEIKNITLIMYVDHITNQIVHVTITRRCAENSSNETFKISI